MSFCNYLWNDPRI